MYVALKERYPSVEGLVGPSQATAPCPVCSRSITHVFTEVKECLSLRSFFERP